MMNIKRTALIGGGSQGIGLACARSLLQHGHHVIICSRDRRKLDEAAVSLKADSEVTVDVIAADLSSAAGMLFLKEALEERGAKIDVLVNNTGGPKPGTVDQLADSDWELGLDQLFWSTLRLYDLVLPGMRARRFGRVINILSTTAVEPAPTLAISSVLRAALASYARLTALAVASEGVTVNSIMPGALRTARTEQLEQDRAHRENTSVAKVREEIEAALPMRRMLALEELGNVVSFLASEAASGASGLLLPLDGLQMRSFS